MRLFGGVGERKIEHPLCLAQVGPEVLRSFLVRRR
mgnify:CR=1 FL=1